MIVRNPHMLRDGFAPAADVARALSKSLSTVHRMVDAGKCEGARDGTALYVKLDSLIAHFKKAQNEPLAKELLRLKTEFAAEARKKLNGSAR